MHPAEIRRHCALDVTSQSLMRSAISQMQLSTHAFHRVLKLLRTIADLAGQDQIAPIPSPCKLSIVHISLILDIFLPENNWLYWIDLIIIRKTSPYNRLVLIYSGH